MSYRRSNKLPKMIVHLVKIYAGKHPRLFAAALGLLALLIMGGAYALFSCSSSGCPTSEVTKPAETYKSPCPYSNSGKTQADKELTATP